MALEFKKGGFNDYYTYYPEMEMHSPFRRYSLVILREESNKESVEKLISEWKLEDFSMTESCIIAFPNPPVGGWDSLTKEQLAEGLRAVQSGMCEPDDYVFECDANGIPLLKCMLNRWHLMNDTRYYVGIGTAAKAACRMAESAPIEVAAVLCVASKMKGVGDETDTDSDFKNLLSDDSDCVFVRELQEELDELKTIGMPYAVETSVHFDFTDRYQKFMKPIRRINTGKYGDTVPRMDFDNVHFDAYLEDSRLGDQDGMKHTWFVHIPECVKQENGDENLSRKYPLVVFFHGGSDSPMEAAEMSKFHELGEKEGFLTVYPWGSDRASWNCNYTENGLDDVAYVKALLGWLRENYPVDDSRIYLSGFSNGAAMAQIYAMEYPEEIAGVCHIDSNWPGHRLGLANVDPAEVEAFKRGLVRKKEFDYLMPVWYTYGTREPSYPVYKGCSQQLQYDFWKSYNHIAIEETQDRENPHPCGCGVPGEVCEELIPDEKYPNHVYQVNRFYSDRESGHLNLYNYVMMHDKGHEVAPSDPILGWQYVKQFQRGADARLIVLAADT